MTPVGNVSRRMYVSFMAFGKLLPEQAATEGELRYARLTSSAACDYLCLAGARASHYGPLEVVGGTRRG